MVDTGFTRPSLSELITRAENDINTNLVGADAKLRRTVLNVLARLVSGQTHGLYEFQKYIARQAIVDTSDKEHLDRWSAIWEVSRKPASYAEGLVHFKGADGSEIPANTIVKRGDDVLFETQETGTVGGGYAAVTIRSVELGSDMNTDPDVTISLLNPLPGIDTKGGTVQSGGLTGGAEKEEDTSLLARILDRIQQPPHGGASFDYRKWALEVPGVTRVWVEPQGQGIGTVTVRFMMDEVRDADNGIPTASDVQTVRDKIYEDYNRPVTADVHVVAPLEQIIDVTIHNLTPDTPDVREEAEAEIKDMFRRIAAPGVKMPVSKIWEAVSIAAGEESHIIASPATDVTMSKGYLAVLGTVTFTKDS
ncbi:MAG: baseplate J/gp47 family protein [Sneathiella sp.]